MRQLLAGFRTGEQGRDDTERLAFLRHALLQLHAEEVAGWHHLGHHKVDGIFQDLRQRQKEQPTAPPAVQPKADPQGDQQRREQDGRHVPATPCRSRLAEEHRTQIPLLRLSGVDGLLGGVLPGLAALFRQDVDPLPVAETGGTVHERIDGVLPEHPVGGALALQRFPQIQTLQLMEPADGVDERLVGLLGHAFLLQLFRQSATPLRRLFQQRQLEGREQ